jgi:hypothetical protein
MLLRGLEALYSRKASILRFMNALSKAAIFPLSILVLLTMSGCERDSYTTWSCINSAGLKSPMILKQAQMQLQDHQYDYCGSLGTQSYFDLKCPAQIQDSSHIFTPSSGKLISNGNDLNCNAL